MILYELKTESPEKIVTINLDDISRIVPFQERSFFVVTLKTPATTKTNSDYVIKPEEFTRLMENCQILGGVV
jgi:hypothetical protein